MKRNSPRGGSVEMISQGAPNRFGLSDGRAAAIPTRMKHNAARSEQSGIVRTGYDTRFQEVL